MPRATDHYSILAINHQLIITENSDEGPSMVRNERMETESREGSGNWRKQKTTTRSCRTRKRAVHYYSPGAVRLSYAAVATAALLMLL